MRTLLRTPARRRAALLVAIAVIGSVIAAALWISPHRDGGTPSASDCGVVADVAQDWRAVGEASNAAAMQPGAAEDPERWAALADKSRQAANSVSAPDLKSDLTSWAAGFDEFANLARDTGKGPEDVRFQRFVDNSKKVAEATDKLQAACPKIATPRASNSSAG